MSSIRRVAFFSLCALTLAACAPAVSPPPSQTATPYLDNRVLIANAPQSSPPAAATCGSENTIPELSFFWVGEDARGIHLDARTLAGDGTLLPVVTLPLPPVQPYHMAAVETPNGCVLFWLDAAQAGAEGNRLYAALLSPVLDVLRGPTPVSDSPTFDYAIASSRGAVWVAWSAGDAGEPTLYATVLDAESRPRAASALTDAAISPAWADDGETLYFISTFDESLYQLTRAENGWSVSVRLTSGLYRAPGDQIIETRVINGGFEWAIFRANGVRQVWRSQPDSAGTWLTPTQVEPESDQRAWPDAIEVQAGERRYQLWWQPNGDQAQLFAVPLDS